MIRILANERQKAEMLKQRMNTTQVVWVSDFKTLVQEGADAYVDLLFCISDERLKELNKLLPAVVIIHSVVDTLQKLQSPFIRINGWAGFLNRPVMEVSAVNKQTENAAREIFTALHVKPLFVPDQPGLIAARVVAVIINEAFLALEEGVSNKAAIDLAMKNGTNYPFGPFEWASIIGCKEIIQLLLCLAEEDLRYQPATLLLQEALIVH